MKKRGFPSRSCWVVNDPPQEEYSVPKRPEPNTSAYHPGSRLTDSDWENTPVPNEKSGPKERIRAAPSTSGVERSAESGKSAAFERRTSAPKTSSVLVKWPPILVVSVGSLTKNLAPINCRSKTALPPG